MTDSSVAWLNRLIDRGRILFVEGVDLRTHETGIEWQRRADQLLQEARAGVKERSPDDAARLETLSPYPPARLPSGHPWWRPVPVLDTASCTSSALCEDNQSVSYHLALIDRLEQIARDWRANPPVPPIAAAKRKRRVHDKPLRERATDWWRELRDWRGTHPGGDEREFIEKIAEKVGLSFAHVEREIRRVRRER